MLLRSLLYNGRNNQDAYRKEKSDQKQPSMSLSRIPAATAEVNKAAVETRCFYKPEHKQSLEV